MSSIEKAIERLIAKNKAKEQESVFGSVENNEVKISEPENKVINKREQEKKPVPVKGTSVREPQRRPVEEKKVIPEPVRVESTEKRICHVNFEELEQAGFLAPNTSRRRLSEEYRVIKRPVLMNAFGHGAAPVENGNLVAVTSSVAGEGKTYTSLNLAMSIAMELDTTILLIDADVIKRSMSSLLGLENETGLMDLLKDPGKDLSEVILATDLPRLKVMSAGSTTSNPTELLASGRMRRLVSELSARYSDRVILFDTPPILETTEASVILDMMGQVLVVVEASGTHIQTVQSAVKIINPEKVIGMILNKNRYKHADSYYGGYYGAEEKSSEDLQ